MITTKFYLDTRSSKHDNTSPLKLVIHKNRQTALLPLNISLLPNQWSKEKEQIINHPNKLFLNNFLQRRKMEVETELLKLIQNGKTSGMTATDIKNCIHKVLNDEVETDSEKVLFVQHFISFAEAHHESTKKLYLHTLSRMKSFDQDVEKLSFSDIDKHWLIAFDKYLSQTATLNARNIHLRNIRAVFNDAINNDITTLYPFRQIKLKYEQTAKRSLTIDQLRTLMSYEVEQYQEKYRDIFVLMFCLIGINFIDLFKLKEITSDGYIEYKRSKTKKLYRIKVEPEALQIINKYRGTNSLLNLSETHLNHQDVLKKINQELKKIGSITYEKYGKKKITPLFPNLSTYWCRHTWATIASQLDIPKDTIAKALGHGDNTVTDIYINFDQKKIDEANRKVLDFVYGR